METVQDLKKNQRNYYNNNKEQYKRNYLVKSLSDASIECIKNKIEEKELYLKILKQIYESKISK